MPGKLHRGVDERIMAVKIGIAVKYRPAEIEFKMAGCRLLPVKGPAIAEESDRVAVPVFLLIHRCKTTGNADIGIAELLQPAIDRFLAEEFIKPVVGFIIANQEYFPDILCDRGKAVHRTGILVYRSLAAVSAIGKHGGFLVDMKAVQLLQGQKGQGHLYRGGGIEIVPGVHTVEEVGEVGAIVLIPVDTRIDQLIVERVGFVEDPEEGGRGLVAQEAHEEAVGARLGGGAETGDKKQAIKDESVHMRTKVKD